MAKKNWAAIFDFDGVLIDSLPLWEKSWSQVSEARKLPYDVAEFYRANGVPAVTFIKEVLCWPFEDHEVPLILHELRQQYCLQIIDGKLKTFPWVFPWLEKIGKEEIPIAIGTSSTREAMNLALERYNFAEWIKTFICADDVRRGKPDPEIFLKAAAVLEVPPERCVVFEDAVLGIRAAKAAGMKAVGIATSHLHHELSQADLVVSSFDELSITRVAALIGQ